MAMKFLRPLGSCRHGRLSSGPGRDREARAESKSWQKVPLHTPSFSGHTETQMGREDERNRGTGQVKS